MAIKLYSGLWLDAVQALHAHRQAADHAMLLLGLVQLHVIWLMKWSAALGAIALCRNAVHHVRGIGNSFGSVFLHPWLGFFANRALLVAMALSDAGVSVNILMSLSKFLAVTRRGSWSQFPVVSWTAIQSPKKNLMRPSAQCWLLDRIMHSKPCATFMDSAHVGMIVNSAGVALFWAILCSKDKVHHQ